MKTYVYYKDGQRREVTGTDEEIATEIAGTPWLPPAPVVEEAPPPAPAAPPSGSETDPGTPAPAATVDTPDAAVE